MLIIDKIVEAVIELGYEGYKTSKETKLLRLIVKENIKRELNSNLALLDEVSKVDRTTPIKADEIKRILISELTFDEFETYCKLHLPLSLLLPSVLDHKNTPKKYKSRIIDIEYESDLVERIYHRLQILKVRANKDLELGDIKYIRALILYFKRILKSKSY